MRRSAAVAVYPVYIAHIHAASVGRSSATAAVPEAFIVVYLKRLSRGRRRMSASVLVKRDEREAVVVCRRPTGQWRHDGTGFTPRSSWEGREGKRRGGAERGPQGGASCSYTTEIFGCCASSRTTTILGIKNWFTHCIMLPVADCSAHHHQNG